MKERINRSMPRAAMLVAICALVVAVGGGAYAAVKLKKNAVKTKNIKNGAVTSPKIAASAKAEFKKEFQGFCQPGAIKGTFVGQPGAPAFVNVVGFNCGQPGNTTSSVQAIRSTAGQYQVKFLGGAGGTGSAVVSGLEDNRIASAKSLGGGVFDVKVRDDDGTLVDGEFSLLAF
jgi:hypothetical protein